MTAQRLHTVTGATSYTGATLEDNQVKRTTKHGLQRRRTAQKPWKVFQSPRPKAVDPSSRSGTGANKLASHLGRQR